MMSCSSRSKEQVLRGEVYGRVKDIGLLVDENQVWRHSLVKVLGSTCSILKQLYDTLQQQEVKAGQVVGSSKVTCAKDFK